MKIILDGEEARIPTKGDTDLNNEYDRGFAVGAVFTSACFVLDMLPVMREAYAHMVALENQLCGSCGVSKETENLRSAVAQMESIKDDLPVFLDETPDEVDVPKE